jgi:hypothetical protein
MARNKDETIQERRENGYYSELGKKGFETTTELHFEGDKVACSIWLRAKGKVADRRMPWQSYPQDIYRMVQNSSTKHNDTQQNRQEGPQSD